jgi:hypothetical protein
LFESEQLQMSLSPNPTCNEVTLHYESGDNQSLQLHIYNLMGRLQYEQNLSATNPPLSNQPTSISRKDLNVMS